MIITCIGLATTFVLKLQVTANVLAKSWKANKRSRRSSIDIC